MCIRLLPIIFITPVCVLRLTGRCRSFILTRPLRFLIRKKDGKRLGLCCRCGKRNRLSAWLVPIRMLLLPVHSAIRRRFFVQRLYYESYTGFFLTLSQRINKAQSAKLFSEQLCLPPCVCWRREEPTAALKTLSCFRLD